MPGNMRKKPSKPNEDFAERRRWRTSSALLLLPPLPLSTGSLGCIMSCILIHNEWRIGEVPMEFIVYFQHFNFPFFSCYTLYLPFASLSCRALFVWTGEKVAFLDSHDCTAHRSWDPQQSRQKPGAKIPIPIPKLFWWTYTKPKLQKVSKPRCLQNRNLTLCTWCLPLFSPAKIFTLIMCIRVERKRSKL